MADRRHADIQIVCPCCGARLRVDTALGKVVSRQTPLKPAKTPDLDHASKLLEKEKARREALFRQSAEEEKVKSRLLDRKFAEGLKKSKGELMGLPVRDIDLD